MLTRYWRSYPYWLQLMLFLLMVFIMIGTATVIVYSILPVTGASPEQVAAMDGNSNRQTINAALLFQAIESIGIFLLPALIFANLAHPRPAQYLGLRAPGKPIQWLLATLVMIGAVPLFIELESLMQLINFGANAKAMQQKNNDIFNAFLKMPTFADFLKAFIVMAILPAIGEELFFRGIFLRFVKKRSKTMAVPVIFTALLFAFAHSSVYGFPSIFFAGILLAVIYQLTGSILCSMCAHLVNNGLQIALVYIAGNNEQLKKVLDSNSLPLPVAIGGLFIFCVSFYALLKNKTPLPQGWEEDYTPEEYAQGGF